MENLKREMQKDIDFEKMAHQATQINKEILEKQKKELEKQKQE